MVADCVESGETLMASRHVSAAAAAAVTSDRRSSISSTTSRHHPSSSSSSEHAALADGLCSHTHSSRIRILRIS